MDQELISIPDQTAMQVFTTKGALDPYLDRIRKEIDAFEADVQTPRGRKDIASMAFKVAKTKTYLEGVGKALADEAKAIPKKIDASRKHVKDTLDQWKDEVRAPLTNWETAEEAREVGHRARIDGMMALAAEQSPDGVVRSAADLRANLASIEAVGIGPECEEFEAEYGRVKDAAIKAVRAAITKRQKFEDDQADLERLRAEAAERAIKDRDEAIRREAADAARIAAETAAGAERTRFEDEAAAAQREAACREAALIAERQAVEQAASAASAKAERDRLQAIEDERQQVAAAHAAETAETARREASRKHCAAINRAAVEALVAGGMTEDTARLAITLIAKKAVPAVSIKY
jgi:colicin import membrane protein